MYQAVRNVGFFKINSCGTCQTASGFARIFLYCTVLKNYSLLELHADRRVMPFITNFMLKLLSTYNKIRSNASEMTVSHSMKNSVPTLLTAAEIDPCLLHWIFLDLRRKSECNNYIQSVYNMTIEGLTLNNQKKKRNSFLDQFIKRCS